MVKQYLFEYERLDSADELIEADGRLLSKAKQATENAYAPYSGFHVGAAALLSNGEIITASNQENASYPAGICAERVLISAAAAMHPNVAINTIAISYNNTRGSSNKPVSPCGICRQSLIEQEARYNQPIKIILSGLEGNILLLRSSSLLLPFSFSATDME